jgi:hypothetical protein
VRIETRTINDLKRLVVLISELHFGSSRNKPGDDTEWRVGDLWLIPVQGQERMVCEVSCSRSRVRYRVSTLFSPVVTGASACASSVSYADMLAGCAAS